MKHSTSDSPTDLAQEVKNRRQFLKLGVFGALGVLGTGGAFMGYRLSTPRQLLQVFHAPPLFARRFGDFTANICGKVSSKNVRIRCRLNDHSWMDIQHSPPRVPEPLFTIELPEKWLRHGTNRLVIEARKGEFVDHLDLAFEYDPSPITLPGKVDWTSNDILDVQDGYWEIVAGENRVRPKPGYEDYDRIVAASGAFAGGRRIETELVFKGESGRLFGFGVLPLWGGRPDEGGVMPRRGWNFSCAWYYSHYKGIGMEFSHKSADAAPDWVSTYRQMDLQSNVPYRVIVEAWPEKDRSNQHKCYRQRMQWFPKADDGEQEWLELSDTEGCALPEGEYAVALVAHRSNVEFGPVLVSAL